MANEHIAKLQKIGLGIEGTSGTAVAAAFWLPKGKGLHVPKIEMKYDQAAYGTIDANREAYVTSKWSELSITDTAPRDSWLGYFLRLVYGQTSYPCVRFTPASITGTYVEGETVTESTSSATGTLRRADQGGSVKALYIEPASGTFTGGQTLTGGTSGATCSGGTIMSPSAGRFHVFRKANTNNHSSATVYAQDPVTGDERAAYAMLDTFDMEGNKDDIIKIALKLMAMPLASVTSQTPTYVSDNPFLGKHISMKFASSFDGLDAASATPIKRFKLNATKGVEVIYQTGTSDPVAPSSLHNTVLDFKGDLSAVFNATSLRDDALAGTAKAMRLKIENSGVTALATGIYPAVQFDFPQLYFTDWGKDDDNEKIVGQNLAWTAVYNPTRSLTSEAILVCSKTSAF